MLVFHLYNIIAPPFNFNCTSDSKQHHISGFVPFSVHFNAQTCVYTEHAASPIAGACRKGRMRAAADMPCEG